MVGSLRWGIKYAIAHGRGLGVWLAIGISSVLAQNYEITPLIGYRLGGTVKLGQASTPITDAHLADSGSFGVSGGYRVESEDGGYNVFAFRWMRQDTHLRFQQNPMSTIPIPTPYDAYGPGPFRPSIALDHFLGDISHEWEVPDYPHLQPFITASFGAARMSTPVAASTRFALGFAAGMNVFPVTRYGFRIKVEYMPIVMAGEAQRVACAGGCVVILKGGLMNQFEVSLGPAFRF